VFDEQQSSAAITGKFDQLPKATLWVQVRREEDKLIKANSL